MGCESEREYKGLSCLSISSLSVCLSVRLGNYLSVINDLFDVGKSIHPHYTLNARLQVSWSSLLSYVRPQSSPAPHVTIFQSITAAFITS
ncbi:hypothetical protein J6590_078712 [Homalodisca vitripennis]|nr:hypothetical protein J6590_078712 [Homalodisca vitripennis]